MPWLPRVTRLGLLLVLVAVCARATARAAEDWPQVKFDARHSGNAPDRSVQVPLGLSGRFR